MIINLTQHLATRDQITQGVRDLPEAQRKRLVELLTFNDLPTRGEIRKRAAFIADLALFDDGDDPESAMIGGAPWLMPSLSSALQARGIRPVFAFSKRMAVEKINPDGSVTKTAEFVHVGFVY